MVNFQDPFHIVGSHGFIGKALKRIINPDKIICWSHQSKDHFIDIGTSQSLELARSIFSKQKTL